MKKSKHRKRPNDTRIEIGNAQVVISTFFWRPMEILRLMAIYNTELKTTILEEASQYFGVKERSVQDHIDKVLELNFFTFGEDGNYYKNNKSFEWLRAYLLPFFPIMERKVIRWMLFRNPTDVDSTMVARSKVYTQQIDDVLRKEFESDLGQKIVNNLVEVIWGVFDWAFIEKDLSNFGMVKENNKREIIAALFKRPLEVMKNIFDLDAELKRKLLVKKISKQFGIELQTARTHINKIIKSGMLVMGEKGEVFKNSESVKWLWSYLLPFYPKRVEKNLKIMLFGVFSKFTSSQLEVKKNQQKDQKIPKKLTVKKYTQRIEKTLIEEFKYEIDENTLKNVVKTIWNVFDDEKS